MDKIEKDFLALVSPTIENLSKAENCQCPIVNQIKHTLENESIITTGSKG